MYYLPGSVLESERNVSSFLAFYFWEILKDAEIDCAEPASLKKSLTTDEVVMKRGKVPREGDIGKWCELCLNGSS